MHERDSYVIRERWAAPVWAPAAGRRAQGGTLDGQPDHFYEDGDLLPGGLRAYRIAGKFAGDSALACTVPGGERVLFTGDTLNGQFNPDNPRPHPRRGAPGLYLGAGPFYLKDLDGERLKNSLRRVLDGEPEIDVICGAHGQPWRVAARATLARLLALDWTSFLAGGRHPMIGPVA
jgi:glyoxylase-like metal-dependent hydrolase (beta-lactamase superfamily II)